MKSKKKTGFAQAKINLIEVIKSSKKIPGSNLPLIGGQYIMTLAKEFDLSTLEVEILNDLLKGE
jgi:hypothetical protein